MSDTAQTETEPTREQLAAIYRYVLRKMYGGATSVMDTATMKTIFTFHDVGAWLERLLASPIAIPEAHTTTSPAVSRWRTFGTPRCPRTFPEIPMIPLRDATDPNDGCDCWDCVEIRTEREYNRLKADSVRSRKDGVG